MKKKPSGAPKPTLRKCIYCARLTAVSPYAPLNTRLRRYQHSVVDQPSWVPYCVLTMRVQRNRALRGVA